MLPEKIHLEIVTPQRRVIDKDVDEVILPGAAGSFGVRPGHAPLLAGLSPGVAVSRSAGQEEVMAISSGYVEVQPGRVVVLAETCEKADEIDVERARSRLREIESEVNQTAEADPDLMRFRMMKHLARLQASGQGR
ncbi:MAG: F0F1 ATP synthase subunit epsilon [Acidobacteriota bacterium]|nr:F0F1 ATP synthase subunit epsilon [Acidobacteriota bacterium]MDQ7086506.1 F0F1 ATP synthase subunit epsilon [Acidobacteriota bacterium]